jgi:hypothetical protein
MSNYPCFSAWVLLPRAEMILAFLIVNNFGKARMLKFYRETVRARAFLYTLSQLR